MLNASDLLSSFYERGVKIWTTGGLLRFQAERDVLNSADIDNLRALKAELIDFLEKAQQPIDDSIEPRPPGCVVPLTDTQLGMWEGWAASGSFMVDRRCASAVRIHGDLNYGLLQTCLAGIIQRHESLRVHFITVEGLPRLQVDREYRGEVLGADPTTSCMNPEEVHGALLDFVGQQVDVRTGPLFKARIFRVSDSEHILLLAANHAITDGLSKQIIWRELWTLYSQGAQRRQFLLPPLVVQFPDYAVWLDTTREIWRYRHETHWRNHLAGSFRTELPTDGPADGGDSCMAVPYEFTLGSRMSTELRRMARRENTSLPFAVLAVFAATISRWCDRREVVIAMSSHGRFRPELEAMVGLLACDVFMRLRIGEKDTYRDLLKSVCEEVAAAHEHLDFDRVARLLPEYGTEVLFNWRSSDSSSWPESTELDAEAGISLQPFELTSIYKLKFLAFFFDTPDITVRVLFRPDMFTRNNIFDFERNMRSFAEGIAQDPSGRVQV